MLKNNIILDKHEVASLGASLREIEQKILKSSCQQGTKRIWFQGDEPYFDIFFELKDDDIVWFQFTLRGQCLSWSTNTGLQTGYTNELVIDDVSFYPASKTIENESKNDLHFINLVKTILQTRSKEPMFGKALTLFDK